MVNGVFLILRADHLSSWTNLPNDGIKLQKHKNLDDLPFVCNWELLWNTLTHRFDLLSLDKITNSMLIPEASILLKIIHHDRYPQAEKLSELPMIILVAIFYLQSKIRINWTSFVMYNMASSTKITRAWHFPRMLSMILRKEHFCRIKIVDI